MHAHALACTHSRHACTQTRRVLGCENRRAKSSQWRAEAGIGGVTHVVNERPIRAPSPVDFELVSRSVHHVCVRARKRWIRERKRKKKVGECTRKQGESHEFAKGEREREREKVKKKKKRDEFASRLNCLPPTLGGKGVKERDRKKGTTCRTRESLGHHVVV